MSAENTLYLEAFPSWLRSLADDAVALAEILAANSTPPAAQRCLAGGLNSLFKSLDLVPDGIDDIGYLDDAIVLRMSAKEALAHQGARRADAKGTLDRLSAELPLVEQFLGSDYPRLAAYVQDLQKGAARGRTVDEIISDAKVRKAFVGEVHDYAKAYSPPGFTRDEKTLMKLRAFISSRLPPQK